MAEKVDGCKTSDDRQQNECGERTDPCSDARYHSDPREITGGYEESTL
jgi:hypothetical protein